MHREAILSTCLSWVRPTIRRSAAGQPVTGFRPSSSVDRTITLNHAATDMEPGLRTP